MAGAAPPEEEPEAEPLEELDLAEESELGELELPAEPEAPEESPAPTEAASFSFFGWVAPKERLSFR